MKKYITINNLGHIQSVINSNDDTLETDGYINIDDIENKNVILEKPHDFKIEKVGNNMRVVELSDAEKQEREPKILPVKNPYEDLQNQIKLLKDEVELLKNKK